MPALEITKLASPFTSDTIVACGAARITGIVGWDIPPSPVHMIGSFCDMRPT
jgi:hypothetical protein